jgi:hypothetical protein
MMSRISHILAAVALIGAAAPSIAADPTSPKGEAELANTLDQRVAGAPVSCINQRDIQSSQVVRGTAIVYQVGRNLYVNRPSGAYSLGNDDILVTQTIGGQLCRMDSVRLVDRTAGFQRGFVILGDFVPYAKDKPKG